MTELEETAHFILLMLSILVGIALRDAVERWVRKK